MNTIGERIVFLREEHNISQKALASTIKISPTSLSRYENNLYEPKAEILNRLASALDTTSDFLIGLTDYYRRPNYTDPSPVGLNADEHRLVNYYNNLNSENKTRINERILTLLDTQKKNNNNN